MSLEALIGEWEIEFTVFGETARGRMSCERELGGAFLLQRTSAEHPDAPDGLCLIAPDTEAGGFTQHYFDSRGVVRRYEMTLDDELWTLTRDDVQRFIGRFEDGGATIRGTWEWKRDGRWEKDFDLVYRRA